jgi:hypothetical protein
MKLAMKCVGLTLLVAVAFAIAANLALAGPI